MPALLKTIPLSVTVGEARAALREALHVRNAAIFMELDHTREAFNDLFTVPASVSFLFGPRHPLWRVLRLFPALGAGLPLSIRLWQDAEGANWLTCTDMDALAALAAGAADDPDFRQLRALMDELIPLINR
ncbi:MAG: hypothetical protein ACI33N_05945 [Desulfovibrionaceae bacterium]|nr:hypothetical protein [Desulfovibrionaceae bacterium]